MKKHPEIKWSEAARRGVVEVLREVEDSMKGNELLEELSTDTRQFIKEAPQEIFVKAYKKWRKANGNA